jgi:branched-chain amino acid transport system ATP-binding protein
MTALLALEGLALNYGAVRAVNDVSFTVASGEITALVGPNGSGKSSLLNVISGFVPPTAGRVQVGERDVSGAPPHLLARLGLARTFQLVRLLGGLTVRENVAAGCYAGVARDGARGLLRSLAPQRNAGDMGERVDAALDRVGMLEDASALVDELPFGSRRRVEVARAIVAEPRLLLLDEPAAGLGERDLEDLEQIIRAEAARGCGVILVDHHLHFVLRTCPRAVVLNFGRLIFDGASDAAVDDPEVRTAYVGA